MTETYFDTQAFMRAINKVRKRKNLVWYRVYRETGVPMSSLKRYYIGEFKSMNVQTMAKLNSFAHLDLHTFIQTREQTTEENHVPL